MMQWMLLGLVGCGSSAQDTADTSEPVGIADFSTAGAYTPGTGTTEITGSSGVPLTVQYWYPSSEDPSGDPIVYDSLAEGGAYEGLTADCAQQRPVLVFSHGYSGVRWQSSFFMEHLASHGYIVVAPDHTHNTLFDNDNAQFLDVVTRRPVDVRDSFDWLVTASADADSPLYGCVDEAQGYAVSGHSFGGYTAYVAAGADISDPADTTQTLQLGDSRVWAAIPLAPWDVDGILSTGTAAITVPVMTLSGTKDTTTDWDMVSGLHNGLTVTPRYLGEFPDAGHYSFAPIACMVYSSTNGCGDRFIDEQTLTALVNVAGTSFLESVRGSDGAIDQLPADSDDLMWEIVE